MLPCIADKELDELRWSPSASSFCRDLIESKRLIASSKPVDVPFLKPLINFAGSWISRSHLRRLLNSMADIPGKYVVAHDVVVETRTARVDQQLATALLGVCQANPHIRACYLLDTRRPGAEEIALTIALTVDNEPANMDSVAQQFQAMLMQFPEQARKTYIMSSDGFLKNHAGSEFYVRKNPWWKFW